MQGAYFIWGERLHRCETAVIEIVHVCLSITPRAAPPWFHGWRLTVHYGNSWSSTTSSNCPVVSNLASCRSFNYNRVIAKMLFYYPEFTIPAALSLIISISRLTSSRLVLLFRLQLFKLFINLSYFFSW